MTKIDAIGIPDSKLCREISELVRDTEPERREVPTAARRRGHCTFAAHYLSFQQAMVLDPRDGCQSLPISAKER